MTKTYLFGAVSCAHLYRLPADVPGKTTKRGLDTLLSKLRESWSTDRRHGSGRPTEENVAVVEEPKFNQWGRPHSRCREKRSLPVLCSGCHTPPSWSEVSEEISCAPADLRVQLAAATLPRAATLGKSFTHASPASLKLRPYGAIKIRLI